MIQVKPFIEPVETWFRQRSRRERTLLGALIVVLLCCVVFLGALQPALQFRNTEIEKHQYEQEGLHWLEQAIDQGLTLQGESPSTATADLIRTLTRTAASYQITLNRQQPSGEAISVEIRDHPFENVARWIVSLHQSHGIRVVTATITSKLDGLVDARLNLQ